MSKQWFRLDERVALVTGAATGLGAATAVALASAGAQVVVSDKPGVSLAETAAEVTLAGLEPVQVALDIRCEGQIAAAMDAIADACGRLDILVNNAGLNRPTAGLDLTRDVWDEHFETNIKGGFFVAQAAAKRFMVPQTYGRIIFISSQSGLIGIPGQPAYCASKGAIINLVRTLGVEWARHGLTVNSVAPTFVETNLTRKRLENPEFRGFVLGKIPAGRLATANEVAAAVVYLASTEAAMVNATTLSVDGGWTAW
jgi:NAD(P)-dependent dehydrogenase (short-subunit alcohol dehydrogenase family)